MAKFYTADNISISTPEDIINRPHYTPSVPPRKSQFRYVLAAYSFPRKIASCCVSDCYQNHKKGYLIRIDNERECSICDTCAARFMEPAALKPPKPTKTRAAVSFAGKSSASPRARATTRARVATVKVATQQVELDTFASESARIKQQVKELKQKPRGANWLFQSQNNFQKAYPLELVNALKALQAEREGEGSTFLEGLVEAQASDQQVKDVEELGGLGIFGDDIRLVLVESILKPLAQLEEKAKKSEPDQPLDVAVDWLDQVESNLTTAELLVAQAQLFFTEANINRLKSIPLSDKTLKVVRKLRWDCDKGVVLKG